MPVPSTISDLSATPSLNSPAGSDAVGNTLDDYLRGHAAIIRQVSDAKADKASPTFTGTVTESAITSAAATDLTLNAPTGQNIKAQINNATVATIDSSGNVGIGGAPTGISTYPTVDVQGSSGAAYRLRTASVAGYIYSDAAGVTFGSATNHPVNFFTNGTQKMTLDAGGNLGIGDTSPSTRGKFSVLAGLSSYSAVTTPTGGGGGGQQAIYYNAVKISAIDTTLNDGTVGSEKSQVTLSTIVNGTLTAAFRIDQSANALVIGPGGLGYGTGSGGTVTQATSKSTAVTLNKTNGQITMNNAALAAGVIVRFSLSNSTLSSADLMTVQVMGGVIEPMDYNVWTVGGGTGAVYICVKNVAAVSRSEAVVIGFAVIKAVTA
jgi:hypothetical protein